MAPLLGPPMTPHPRNCRIVPIVPAIPRSLEKKPKEHNSIASVSREVPISQIPPAQQRTQEPPTAEKPVIRAQKPQSEKQIETAAGANVEVESLLERDALLNNNGQGREDPEVAVKTILPSSTTQDFGIERHGFKLPPPFYPKKSPPAAITTDFPPPNDHVNTLQGSARAVEESNPEQDPGIKRMSLRGSAPRFHAHPTPPSDNMTSPTPSSPKGFPDTQSISFHPQPTPPTDTTPSPTQSYQGSNHAQSLAFSPPPPTSSHNASSPTHSIYQGYIYGPTPYDYSPDVPATRQPSVFGRPEADNHNPPKQHGENGSPFYSHPPGCPLSGSQPPLTPSATPFNYMPQHSYYINGYLPNESMGYNYASQIPGLQPQNGYPGHDILKSGDLSSPIGEQASNGIDVSQANIYQSQVWPQPIMNSPHDPPTNGPLSQAPLVAHLLQNFNLPEYADCRLVLTHKEERFGMTQWYLNSLLLAQSTKLREMLRVSQTGTDGRKIIQLRLTDRFINPKSMESVLRVCYGESPYVFAGTIPQDQFSKTRTEALRPWMTETLSFAAVGCLLRIDSVVLRGLDITSKILSWENLETALSFGLESEIERGRSASVSVIPIYRPLHPVDGEHLSSCAMNPLPSDDTPTTDIANIPPGSNSSSGEYHPPQPQYALDLLMHCLQFLADNFPVSWTLDVTARPLADVDRLPVTAESRSPLSKSRLCTIQFGDRPSEAIAKSADHNVLVSTILLSLPHIWLDYLLKSVGEPIRREITTIVKERERRRHIILRSESVSWEQRDAAKDFEWAEVGYEESVQTSVHGELTLSRRYTGIARDVVDDQATTKAWLR